MSVTETLDLGSIPCLDLGSIPLQTIDQYHFFLSSIKYLKNCYIVVYIPTYQNLTYLAKDNLGLEKIILLFWQYATFMTNY